MKKTAIAIALLCVAAACAKSTGALTRPSPSASFPATIGSLTLSAKPTKIVSMSSTATEDLFAIGAGSQVVAVDKLSNYPAQAPHTTIDAYQPNVEAISKLDPDLVVVYYDPGNLVKSLKALSIPVLLQPAAKTLNEAYAQIEDLGKATGHPAEAAGLVHQMQTQIQQIVSSAPHFDTPPTYYHELDNTYFTATSTTFIGQIYSLLGLKNIADPADKKASGYLQLSAEYIVHADPKLIFLADTKCCGQNATTVGKRPGWSNIAAVKNGDVVPLDDDIVSRWGPRIVDFLRTVETSLQTLKAAA